MRWHDNCRLLEAYEEVRVFAKSTRPCTLSSSSYLELLAFSNDHISTAKVREFLSSTVRAISMMYKCLDILPMARCKALILIITGHGC